MAQQDTQSAGSGTDSAAIAALRNRAITGLLINGCHPPEVPGRYGFSFWQGYIKALQDLSSGAGRTLAASDKMCSGYKPLGYLQAAFTALAECAESATFAKVEQLLSAQGVQVTGHPVALLEADASEQLENGVSGIVDAHDKHAPAMVDGNDGSLFLHGNDSLRSNRLTVAQEGGAA